MASLILHPFRFHRVVRRDKRSRVVCSEQLLTRISTQSGDTVSGMIHYQLDAMFMYTVTMGLTALLMAWVILMVALKGWAARREAWLEAGLA